MFEEQDVYATYKKPTQPKIYKGRRSGSTVKADPNRLHTDSTLHHQYMTVCALERGVDSVQIGSETFKTARTRRTSDQGVMYSLNKNKRWELAGDRRPTKTEERRKKREVLEEDHTLVASAYATDTPVPVLSNFNDPDSGITAAISAQSGLSSFQTSKYNRYQDNNAFGLDNRDRADAETRARWAAEEQTDALFHNTSPRDKLKRTPISRNIQQGTRVIRTRKGPKVIQQTKKEEIVETTTKPTVDYAISLYCSPGRYRRHHNWGYYDGVDKAPRCHKHRYDYGE